MKKYFFVDSDRIVLHSDINNCYANIELHYHPELRGKPVAVGGEAELRHGIILAKDELAKKAGVKTGMALWEAKRLCPGITVLPPRMDLYQEIAHKARAIYAQYTDMQEPFGLDESFLDVTGSAAVVDIHGKIRGVQLGIAIAEQLRERFKKELGITVSVGVSWNKIFAKLGSDLKKPDAVTVITKDNYKDVVFPLPVKDLLYVGQATGKKLYEMGIYTIGDLANTPACSLTRSFGKAGTILYTFANGLDDSPVSMENAESEIRSIGNPRPAIW